MVPESGAERPVAEISSRAARMCPLSRREGPARRLLELELSRVARLLRSLQGRSEEKAGVQEAEEGRRRRRGSYCTEHGLATPQTLAVRMRARYHDSSDQARAEAGRSADGRGLRRPRAGGGLLTTGAW